MFPSKFLSCSVGNFDFSPNECFKDRQQRVAADLRYSRLSLTHSLLYWIRMYIIYD